MALNNFTALVFALVLLIAIGKSRLRRGREVEGIERCRGATALIFCSHANFKKKSWGGLAAREEQEAPFTALVLSLSLSPFLALARDGKMSDVVLLIEREE